MGARSPSTQALLPPALNPVLTRWTAVEGLPQQAIYHDFIHKLVNQQDIDAPLSPRSRAKRTKEIDEEIRRLPENRACPPPQRASPNSPLLTPRHMAAAARMCLCQVQVQVCDVSLVPLPLPPAHPVKDPVPFKMICLCTSRQIAGVRAMITAYFFGGTVVRMVVRDALPYPVTPCLACSPRT